MHYAIARWNERNREETYRIYVTDALKIIGENTQRFAGGKALKQRYAEIAHPEKKKVDKRSGEQIVADIIAKIARKED